ncbi:cation acetate symporter [Pseudonocardiaceae bacterium YIM PH 21723]|nr:cation acetate symporter [Pseudonocardiaceae bacterium YIM PH 21723]
MQHEVWALTGIGAVALLSFLLGFQGARSARTTSDFLVARRAVKAQRNAAAISGEYLSAASFLGVAGLILKDGANALWFPIGFTAGYLALMLFVAAPLRRSGAYTLPDFAEARLGSSNLRQLSTVFVLVIGWLYLVPQLQGAGLTLATVTKLPYWVGATLVTALVMINVLSGGMRVVTLVQAVQYWVKLFAISLPAFVLFLVFLSDHSEHRASLSQPMPPTFVETTVVKVETDVTLQVGNPVRVVAKGIVDNDRPVDGVLIWNVGTHKVKAGTQLTFPAGASVPVASGQPLFNSTWLRPQSDSWSSLFQTYSVIFATFLGTMGLPHVLVRFYTNPDGRSARRTTQFVLLMLSVFYVFPIIFGLLARLYVPQLLITGNTDAAVLLLPNAMLDNWVGIALGSITAAGAFAAFVSTSSGLVVSVAGVLSTDVLKGKVRDFRTATLISGLVPLAVVFAVHSSDLSRAVTMAFSLAASTFCPMLVLGIWWRRLTAVGAAAGLVVGGGLCLLATVYTLATGGHDGWLSQILAQPSAITVPLAFLTMWGVSRATARRVPLDVSRTMLRMHAPDRLGFIRDRDVTDGVTTGADDDGRMRSGRHRRG